jgi:hypothetical protein
MLTAGFQTAPSPLQDWRAEPFGEPVIDGREKIAGLGALALIGSEA